jgi:hypothetical protein
MRIRIRIRIRNSARRTVIQTVDPQHCVQVLSSAVNENNWMKLLLLSNVYGAVELKQRVLQYVKEKRDSLAGQEGWRLALAGLPDIYRELLEAVVV